MKNLPSLKPALLEIPLLQYTTKEVIRYITPTFFYSLCTETQDPDNQAAMYCFLSPLPKRGHEMAYEEAIITSFGYQQSSVQESLVKFYLFFFFLFPAFPSENHISRTLWCGRLLGFGLDSLFLAFSSKYCKDLDIFSLYEFCFVIVIKLMIRSRYIYFVVVVVVESGVANNKQTKT